MQAHKIKFDSWARKSISMRYQEGPKGFILYDFPSHAIYLSKNVIFYESYFPFKIPVNSAISQPIISTLSNTIHTLDNITLDC